MLEKADQLPLELLGPPAQQEQQQQQEQEQEGGDASSSDASGRRRLLEPGTGHASGGGAAGREQEGEQQQQQQRAREEWSIEDDDGDDEGAAGAAPNSHASSGDQPSGEAAAPGGDWEVVRRSFSLDLPDLPLSSQELQQLVAAGGRVDPAGPSLPAKHSRQPQADDRLELQDRGSQEEDDDSAAAGHILHRLLAGLDRPAAEGGDGFLTAAEERHPQQQSHQQGSTAPSGSSYHERDHSKHWHTGQGGAAAPHHGEPLQWLQQLEALAPALGNGSSVGRIRHLGAPSAPSSGTAPAGGGQGASAAAGRRLQQAAVAPASGQSNALFANAFKLIFGNALDLFISGELR
jgi:hypothetical protein